MANNKEFISKTPSPSPSRGAGYNIYPPFPMYLLLIREGYPFFCSPPLRGGDEGEGEVCGFTKDCISKRKNTFLCELCGETGLH